MYQQRGAGRLLRLAAVILILQGCASSEESDDAAAVLPGEQNVNVVPTGSSIPSPVNTPPPPPLPPPPPGSMPPTISGAPSTVVLQDTAYLFMPSGSDPDTDRLMFLITGQPAWTAFDPATGALSGTPTMGDVGTYANIVISVSDGRASASLPSFSITVNAISLGSATLSWEAPTTNEDGSPLTDLAGYRIYWGQSPGSYSNDVIVMNPGLTTYGVDNLTRTTTYYFAVKARNSNDVESTFSNEASKLIL